MPFPTPEPTTTMQRDSIRERIHDLLWQHGLNLRQASLAIGRNSSYMHRFLERGMPKVLSYEDVRKLAELLGCEEAELRHAERPHRSDFGRKRTGKEGRREAQEAHPPQPIRVDPTTEAVKIPEVGVDASAGPGALTGEHVDVEAHWFLPEYMIRHEGGASPGAVCILRVRGDSMEPELSDGDRLVVDTARRTPATGEMFVLWDGSGLVVKRIEILPPDGGPPRLRLKSANPDYADYDCPAEGAHIAGRVLWSVRRA
ncbi:MAG: LexA family transcriptional regulator [Gammaproteobacteria bacterium]|nr:LexA family transcriptional regulator [Gammaproteobacteria bacterium]